MKLREYLERLAEEQRRLTETQIEIQSDLKYHIRRTDLLEDRVERDLPAVKRHVDLVNGLAKVFTALVTVGAGVAAVIKLFL